MDFPILPPIRPVKNIGKTTLMPRAAKPHPRRRILVLPRIPVKPYRNATTVTALPYQPRPPLGWCDYFKEVGVESPKCGGGRELGRPNHSKLEEKGGENKRKKKGERKSKKERIVVELLERTMEEQQGEKTTEEESEQTEEEEKKKTEEREERRHDMDGQRQLLLVIAEQLRRKLKQQQEEQELDKYLIEGVGNFPSCQGHFVRCRPSTACASGALCHSRQSDAHCCRRHADMQCPRTDVLGYICRQENPVNWCNMNADCATNALRSRICCPTGCGYNVCLSNVQQPTIGRIGQMEARTRLMSPDCPSPFEIRIKCVVPRPTSWCHSARECPTYSKAYPRRCCLTPCGNNVCITKFGENRWIIA